MDAEESLRVPSTDIPMAYEKVFSRSEDLEQEMGAVPDMERSLRYGGAQADEDSEKKKMEERDRKKAEVRKRLEESGKAGKKKKKGFLTPERKKKLRKVLMMKAADALKAEQLEKEKARGETLKKRIIALPDLETINDKGALDKVADEMYKRWIQLEGEKYDVQLDVRCKDTEINELSITVNDLKGKFVKPTLKKVSKYDNKFKKAKQAEGETKADFKVNLKKAKKEENVLEAIMSKAKKHDDKPEWSKGAKKEKVEEEPKSEAASAPKEDKGDDGEPAADAEPEAEEPAAEGEEEEEEEE